jgi:hypothetical protein
MTKTLNQNFVFSSTKIRIFFSAILGIRIFFLEKTITPPPLQVKWSAENLNSGDGENPGLEMGTKNVTVFKPVNGVVGFWCLVPLSIFFSYKK